MKERQAMKHDGPHGHPPPHHGPRADTLVLHSQIVPHEPEPGRSHPLRYRWSAHGELQLLDECDRVLLTLPHAAR